MTRHHLAAARAACVVLAVALALGGCGDDEADDGADGGGTGGTSLEEELAGLPGVQDVSVTETAAEDGADEVLTEVVVDLEPDPASADVVAVLEALVEARKGRNAVYVDAPGSPWSEGVEPGRSGVRNAADGIEVEQAASVLEAGLAVADDLGGDAAIDVDLNLAETDPTVTVLPASFSAADVRAAEEAVAADAVLGDAGAVVLSEGFSP